MNLKKRFSIIFSSLFSILLAVVMVVVFSLFEQFRTEEFKARLEEKAKTTIKLLLDVKEVDKQLLKIIDKNTINNLYNEKVLVFDDSLHLIYSSLDDAVLSWDKEDLQYLKKNNTFFKKDGDGELFGVYYDTREEDYYALVKAEDKYGLSKLSYLKYLLIGAYIISNLIIWILSFYLSKISLEPLDIVTNKIKEITEKNLNVRLDVNKNKDEINALSNSFNEMLNRIEKSYQLQKEFTSNASHELRTPISRIVTQIENIIQREGIDESIKKTLASISEDSYQLSELVSSLLLLSKIEETEQSKFFKDVRLDEVIFNSSAVISKLYPDYKMAFEIQNHTEKEIDFELKADESLLKIAFINIFKNAYLYSNNRTAYCNIHQYNEHILVTISNTGKQPDVIDTEELFQPFKRASNSINKAGSGLGLGITKRIIQYHQGQISFHLTGEDKNEIQVKFTF